MITEDRKIMQKAKCLGLERVYSIDRFLSKCLDENPQLKNYNMLSVKKTTFSKVNLNDPFFDSLKNDYLGFKNGLLKNMMRKHMFAQLMILFMVFINKIRSKGNNKRKSST